MNDIRKAISIVENPNINSNKKISRHKFASVFFKAMKKEESIHY